MGSRRGSRREAFFSGNKKSQDIHKTLTNYLKEKKSEKVILKTVLQALQEDKTATRAIVVSGKAAQKAYTEIKNLRDEGKKVSDDDIDRIISKSWSDVKKDENLTPTTSLNNNVLDSLKETVRKTLESRGGSK